MKLAAFFVDHELEMKADSYTGSYAQEINTFTSTTFLFN